MTDNVNSAILSTLINSLRCLTIVGFVVTRVHGSAYFQEVITIADEVSPILPATDQGLYGTTWGMSVTNMGTIFSVARDGSAYRELYRFTGSNGDGAKPVAGLIEGSDGALYGTTYEGGFVSPSASAGYGVVFKISKDGGDYRILHRFGSEGPDGSFPVTPLAEGADGILYGMTSSWGLSPTETVFALSRNGTDYRILHRFDSTRGDGYDPQQGLIAASDGAFYGIVSRGPDGGVFRLGTDGSYREIYIFNQVEGQPEVLMEGRDGALYGTTLGGGIHDVGTVFKLNKDGSGYTLLYSFGNVTIDTGMPPYDGASFSTPLIEVQRGRLEGISQGGGSGLGAWFELFTDGSRFRIESDLDARTVAYLALGRDGTLFGTTVLHSWGGDQSKVFRLYPPETPDLLISRSLAGGAEIRLSGIANDTYGILSSIDLVHWSTLTIITMPLSGSYTGFVTPQSPPAKFYRAVWFPSL